MDNLDSLSNLALLSIEDISSIVGRTFKRAVFDGREVYGRTVKGCALMESQGIEMTSYEEDSYPQSLRQIKDPPLVIFYRGKLDCLYKKSVSVVGTRRICRAGAEGAMKFAEEAASDNWTVISGLANGVDAFAHRGALAAEKMQCTAAVLPSGIDVIVPSGHKNLAASIIRHEGCVLSEYIPGSPSESWRFVQRNRIIAALSAATVVIQAPANSGALITADFAVNYNREVFLHEANFCTEAVSIDAASRRKLKSVKSSVQLLAEEGAPVIKDYKDFVQAMKDEPGTHVLRNKAQLELFQDE